MTTDSDSEEQPQVPQPSDAEEIYSSDSESDAAADPVEPDLNGLTSLFRSICRVTLAKETSDVLKNVKRLDGFNIEIDNDQEESKDIEENDKIQEYATSHHTQRISEMS